MFDGTSLTLISQSKEEGKNQELMQSRTTPDPGHHMGKVPKTQRKHHRQESQEVNPFLAGDPKAAMNRQDSMKDTKHELQK